MNVDQVSDLGRGSCSPDMSSEEEREILEMFDWSDESVVLDARTLSGPNAEGGGPPYVVSFSSPWIDLGIALARIAELEDALRKIHGQAAKCQKGSSEDQ